MSPLSYLQYSLNFGSVLTVNLKLDEAHISMTASGAQEDLMQHDSRVCKIQDTLIACCQAE